MVPLCCILSTGGWCRTWTIFSGHAVMHLHIGTSFIFGASLARHRGLKDMIDEFFLHHPFHEKGRFSVACWSMYYFSRIFRGVGRL